MDRSSVRIKERVAEEFYNKFDASYRRKDLREASKNLWECIQHLVLALGFCENKDLADIICKNMQELIRIHEDVAEETK